MAIAYLIITDYSKNAEKGRKTGNSHSFSRIFVENGVEHPVQTILVCRSRYLAFCIGAPGDN